MSSNITTKALTVVKAGKKYEAKLVEKQLKPLQDEEILVRMSAAAFNHRDLWIRKGQYPSIGVGSTFGADGCGVVVQSSMKDDPLLRRRVFLMPMVGWEDSVLGPESRFGIVGGTKYPDVGTMSELLVVKRSQVLDAPSHLSDEEVAAWPLAGITAWRAVVTKAGVSRGSIVLITGIGGGVALTALQLCVALGAKVFVTSGDQKKIDKAVALGAAGGVSYKSDKWPEELGQLLKKQLLDVVLDSAGGIILAKTNRLLNLGARVVCYGMTAQPQIAMSMKDVLKNIELKGSTMGSRKELIEATEFISRNKVVPVVSSILNGLDNAEDGFRQMDEGSQFGKIVIRIANNTAAKL